MRTNESRRRRPRDTESGVAEQFLAPAPHECGANLIFTDDGLQPYFALDRVTKDNDGTASARITHDGEQFDVSLYYQKSGLKPPERDDFRLETVREFRIRVIARAEPRERKASYHIAPRWPHMESKGDGPNPSTPNIEGVNVRIDGSNLPLDSYPTLLRKAADALNVNARYFDQIHNFSNIFAFERYARTDRSKSSKLVGMGSPMRRIFEHVAGDSKYRLLREDDRGIEGYHQKIEIDSAGAAALIPGHSLGKKIKHYHPEHVRSDPNDPLYHPKLGVSLKRNANATGSVPWHERGALTRELDETLLNLLSWAGLPPRADDSIYVPDAYFEVRESARDLTLIDDPTPEIRRRQDALVIDGITANADLNDSDTGTLEVIADGGRTPEEIASEIGCSKRTIYRVVKRLSNLLRLKKGTVSFVSDYLAEQVASALAGAAELLDKDGESGGETSAFVAWARRHGVEVDDERDARLKLRLGRITGDVNVILQTGLFAWIAAGRDRRRFEIAEIRYHADGYQQVKTGLR